MKKKPIVGKIVDHEKQKAKKKVKKGLRHIAGVLFGCVFLFGMGYLFGMHHKLVVALVKKEALPETAKGCWWRR